MSAKVITLQYNDVLVPCDAVPDPTTIAVAAAVAKRLGLPVVLHSIVSSGLEASCKYPS